MKEILYIMLSIILSMVASCKENREVKVTITEENGSPVEGVNVLVGYVGYTEADSIGVKGKTDKLGMFIANGHPPLRMKVMLDKEGYYPSVVHQLSKSKNHDLTIVLRKKMNPMKWPPYRCQPFSLPKKFY